MTTRLGELVDRERHRNFVGRQRELAGFADALAGESSLRVILAHGPGGIGKTTLLLELRGRARDAGRTVLYIDGREVDPSREGFEDAIVGALGPARAPTASATFVIGRLTPISRRSSRACEIPKH